MMLNCKKCGAPYTGGVICEKCGNRFDEADIRNFENEARQQREYEQFHAERRKESENKAVKAIFIVIGIFIGLTVLGVLVAIFVPALLKYNAKKTLVRVRRNSFSLFRTNFFKINKKGIT